MNRTTNEWTGLQDPPSASFWRGNGKSEITSIYECKEDECKEKKRSSEVNSYIKGKMALR